MSNTASDSPQPKPPQIPNREGEIKEVAKAVRDFLQKNEASFLLQRAVSVAQGKPTDSYTTLRCTDEE